MGFSFRSLYNDDAQPSQEAGGSAISIAQDSNSHIDGPPLSRKTMSGIPGPLKEATASKAPSRGLYDDSAFYSLDELEPERNSREDVSIETSAPSASAPLPKPLDERSHEAQITLRAIFATSDSLDLNRIAALTARLPGIASCIIKTSDHAVLAKVESDTVRQIDMNTDIPQLDTFRSGFDLLGLEKADGFRLRSETDSVSCFSFAGVSLMARHSGEELEPGLWEKLILITKSTAGLL